MAVASAGHSFCDRNASDHSGKWDEIGATDDQDQDNIRTLNDANGSQDQVNFNCSHKDNNWLSSGVVHMPDGHSRDIFAVDP